MASLEPSGSSISPGISRILVKSEFTFSRGHQSRRETEGWKREGERDYWHKHITYIISSHII